MKIKEQKTQSVANEKLPYEKPILHVLGGTPQTYGKFDPRYYESTKTFGASAAPS